MRIGYTKKQAALLRLFAQGKLHRYTILSGSVRSGKTWISLVIWAFWVATRPKEKTLGSNITKALEDLNFLDVRFEIEVTKKDQISADGMDQIRFMISTNPGLPMRPVQEVASGGELSRIMLALKSVAAQADGVEMRS